MFRRFVRRGDVLSPGHSITASSCRPSALPLPRRVPDFERRFPEGAPSLREATSLTVNGDWTFGAKVKVVGEVTLKTGAAERVAPGSVLEHD